MCSNYRKRGIGINIAIFLLLYLFLPVYAAKYPTGGDFPTFIYNSTPVGSYQVNYENHNIQIKHPKYVIQSLIKIFPTINTSKLKAALAKPIPLWLVNPVSLDSFENAPVIGVYNQQNDSIVLFFQPDMFIGIAKKLTPIVYYNHFSLLNNLNFSTSNFLYIRKADSKETNDLVKKEFIFPLNLAFQQYYNYANNSFFINGSYSLRPQLHSVTQNSIILSDVNLVHYGLSTSLRTGLMANSNVNEHLYYPYSLSFINTPNNIGVNFGSFLSPQYSQILQLNQRITAFSPAPGYYEIRDQNNRIIGKGSVGMAGIFVIPSRSLPLGIYSAKISFYSQNNVLLSTQVIRVYHTQSSHIKNGSLLYFIQSGMGLEDIETDTEDSLKKSFTFQPSNIKFSSNNLFTNAGVRTAIFPFDMALVVSGINNTTAIADYGIGLPSIIGSISTDLGVSPNGYGYSVIYNTSLFFISFNLGTEQKKPFKDLLELAPSEHLQTYDPFTYDSTNYFTGLGVILFYSVSLSGSINYTKSSSYNGNNSSDNNKLANEKITTYNMNLNVPIMQYANISLSGNYSEKEYSASITISAQLNGGKQGVSVSQSFFNNPTTSASVSTDIFKNYNLNISGSYEYHKSDKSIESAGVDISNTTGQYFNISGGMYWDSSSESSLNYSMDIGTVIAYTQGHVSMTGDQSAAYTLFDVSNFKDFSLITNSGIITKGHNHVLSPVTGLYTPTNVSIGPSGTSILTSTIQIQTMAFIPGTVSYIQYSPNTSSSSILLSGSIVDKDGKPIPNAYVNSLGNLPTDSAGFYNVDLQYQLNLRVIPVYSVVNRKKVLLCNFDLPGLRSGLVLMGKQKCYGGRTVLLDINVTAESQRSQIFYVVNISNLITLGSNGVDKVKEPQKNIQPIAPVPVPAPAPAPAPAPKPKPKNPNQGQSLEQWSKYFHKKVLQDQ